MVDLQEENIILKNIVYKIYANTTEENERHAVELLETIRDIIYENWPSKEGFLHDRTKA